MAISGFPVFFLLFSSLAATCRAVTFSSLQETLIVTASPRPGQVLRAGEDEITVTWWLNATFPASTDSSYRTVRVKLCYAPVSQKDRGWRKTVDNLAKDKTCQHTIVARPYTSSNTTVTWTVLRDVPTATYFIRAYAYNSADEAAAYGQTTNAHKTTNLFQVEAITGRHVSLDIASVCFSAFAILSLFGFFFLERRTMKAQEK